VAFLYYAAGIMVKGSQDINIIKYLYLFLTVCLTVYTSFFKKIIF